MNIKDARPLVSVIVPVYNRVDLVEATLRSVLAQTYQHWECIVVDDGSTDGTFELIESIAASDNRVKLFRRNTIIKGAPVCRNIGLEKSTGEYIIYLDSDDLLAPFCLENRVHDFSRNRDQDFLVYPMLVFKDTPYDLNLLWNVENEETDLDRFLRMDALWQTTGPIYRRLVLVAEKGFREELSFWQDYDLHLRLLLKGYSYRKFLSAVPDCFYRGHYNNRESICTPYEKDDTILDKKVDFFFYQLRFLKSENIRLGEKQRLILWQVLTALIGGYLVEESKPLPYIRKWHLAGRLLEPGWYNHSISFIYQFIVWLSEKSHYFIKLKTAYFQFFKSRIADREILSKNAIGKIRYLPAPLVNS